MIGLGAQGVSPRPVFSVLGEGVAFAVLRSAVIKQVASVLKLPECRSVTGFAPDTFSDGRRGLVFPALPGHIDYRSKEECGSCMGAKKVEGLFLEFFVGEVRHDMREDSIQDKP